MEHARTMREVSVSLSWRFVESECRDRCVLRVDVKAQLRREDLDPMADVWLDLIEP